MVFNTNFKKHQICLRMEYNPHIPLSLFFLTLNRVQNQFHVGERIISRHLARIYLSCLFISCYVRMSYILQQATSFLSEFSLRIPYEFLFQKCRQNSFINIFFIKSYYWLLKRKILTFWWGDDSNYSPKNEMQNKIFPGVFQQHMTIETSVQDH